MTSLPTTNGLEDIKATMKQEVAASSLNLPPFNDWDPNLWFAQVELQFLVHGVLSEQTKFVTVMEKIPSEAAQEVREIVLNPPLLEPYTKLKTELVKRLTSTDQRKRNQARDDWELKERTPSQVLQLQQQLLENRELDAITMKQLFMLNLPMKVQAVLDSTSDSITIEKLAALADGIVENCNITDSSSDSTLKNEIRQLTSHVKNLVVQVQKLVLNASAGGRATRARTSSRIRRSTVVESHHASSECWFHWKYGDAANKCHSPCSRRLSTSYSQ